MNKIRTLEEVTELLHDDQVLMTGGFLGAGSPDVFIEAILKKGIKGLTVIANDTGFPDRGVGKLVVSRQIKKMIATHVGTNKETGRLMNSGEMEVILVPQGTLAEKIRSAGAGLGGFLTPTGVGTSVEEGKQKITVDGKEYLLELPIKAEIALIHAFKADELGNLAYKVAARNFNPLMAMAADLVIAEVEDIVNAGELDPDEIVTPATLVDMIVKV